MNDMDKRIRKIYQQMTETVFCILFFLQEERHGCGISLSVLEGVDVLSVLYEILTLCVLLGDLRLFAGYRRLSRRYSE